MSKIVSVILLKELVILPNQEIKIELNNKLSKKVIKRALDINDGKLLVVAPIDKKEEEPSVEDLPKVGVVAKIKNKIQLSNGNIRVTLRGIERVVVKKYYLTSDDSDILSSEVEKVELPKYDVSEEKAIRRKLLEVLKEYIDSSEGISNSILTTLKDTTNLEKITDVITSFLPFDVSKKLEYMQNINALNRATQLIKDIYEEIKVVNVDNRINSMLNDEIEQSQREFLLKEKIKVIKKELGDISLQEEETIKFRSLLSKIKLSKETKSKISHEIDKFEMLNDSSPEIGVMRNYLDWVLNLPWNKLTKENSNFDEVRKVLDSSHYGLDDVKTRIVEYVAVKNINPEISSPIICLVGPPGVGKTSIAMSIASALNRKFYKISVGGLNDSSELVGNRRTYLGANPGKVIQGLKKCGTRNPVLLIDEVDKMVKDYKGDPASTLLEIIDPIQNKSFTDNYIEEPFDLSDTLFILTANYVSDIPETILDRVELIELNSYTLFEKKDIAKKYFLPRIIDEHKIINSKIKFSDELLYFIIKNYTAEAGVRELERVIASLIRKIAINNVKNLSEEKVIKLLGKPKYEFNSNAGQGLIGMANSLGVTPLGGVVSRVETLKFKGNGMINSTGSIGAVMDESIYVAVDMLKNGYGISMSSADLHVHFLSAAVKKDGPSAGVAISVAILSLFEKKIIPNDIAFTGEITLNGRVLKIGGLKEKLIGAFNNGISKVYIPRGNEVDLSDVPTEIKESLEIIIINNFYEIYLDLFK